MNWRDRLVPLGPPRNKTVPRHGCKTSGIYKIKERQVLETGIVPGVVLLGVTRGGTRGGTRVGTRGGIRDGTRDSIRNGTRGGKKYCNILKAREIFFRMSKLHQIHFSLSSQSEIQGRAKF